MRKYFMMTLLLGAICAGCVLNIEAAMVQQEIAKEVIRLHVVAEDDTVDAQNLKMKVKEQIVEYLDPILTDCGSVSVSRARIMERLSGIEKEVEKILEEEGKQVSVSAVLTKTWFPEKVYGDCTFPAGVYEALQVKLGKAKGQNWWCVLYPGLCFEHCIRGVVPKEGKEKLSDVLSEESMETILNGGKVKLAFRWF